MLKLILGPDHKVNTRTLLNEILQKTSQGHGNQYLIVPEQFSFEMERTLCRLGGDSISRFAEVLSLSRLAGRVESIYGETAVLWLDKGGRLLAAAQAVEHVRSRLKLFASVCQKPEFLEMFLAVVDEFGAYGVTSQQLSIMSGNFSGQFAQKLQELALLYESYIAVCTQAKDPVLRLQNLKNALAEEDFAQGKDFYVCQFTDFTALEREILEELILSASSVTIALPDEVSCGAPVFSASAAAVKALMQFCARTGIATKIEHQTHDASVPSGLGHLQKFITCSETENWIQPAPELCFCKFASEEQECRYAAAQIRKLVENGARYRDIGVACSDFSHYGSALEHVLDQVGIPHFASQKNSVTDLGGTQMVLSAVRAVASGLDRDDVIDYLKSGSCTLTMDACDRLENYAVLWNVSGSHWVQPWTWHPFGVGEAWSDEDHALLAQLNSWRKTGLRPLFALRTSLQNAQTVGDMAQAVFDFMTETNFPGRMQEMANRLFDREEYQKSQQYGQLYDILVDALEQMGLIMAEAVRSPEEFCRLFEKLLTQYTVGSIPATVDEVLVGDISAFRGKAIPHLLILGASEGMFPACVQSSGIFTEEERRKLLSAGVSMAPLRSDAVERELGVIYAAIRSATHSLSMSCTGEASYLLTKAAGLFSGVAEQNSQDIALNEDEYASILLRMDLPSDRESTSRKMEDFRIRSSYEFGTLSPEQVQGIYGKELFLSASRIDKFAACRFAYFLRYGLKAQQRKQARFDASAFGTFVHAVLEKTVQEVMQRGGFRAVSDDQLQTIAESVMDEYADEVLSDLTEKESRFWYLFSRNRQEAMAIVRDLGKELRVSQFEPVACELEFGQHGAMPPVRVEGKTTACTLSGFVDRVDLYHCGDTAYVRVVDYKTGRKEFDYTDVSIGEGMQMLIYLFALTENGEKVFHERLQPAGVLYFPARQDVISNSSRPTEAEAQKQHQLARVRKGLIADNDVVISAMEDFENTPQFLPFTVKNEHRSGDLANSRQTKLLQKHVFETLARLADEIGSGAVSPNPVIRGAGNSACTYCEYADVCQKDMALHHQRHLKKMSNQEFFDSLERKETGHGEA